MRKRRGERYLGEASPQIIKFMLPPSSMIPEPPDRFHLILFVSSSYPPLSYFLHFVRTPNNRHNVSFQGSSMHARVCMACVGDTWSTLTLTLTAQFVELPRPRPRPTRPDIDNPRNQSHTRRSSPINFFFLQKSGEQLTNERFVRRQVADV